jgi:hypothetical protein
MYRLLKDTWFTDPSGVIIISIFLFFVGLQLSGRSAHGRPRGLLIAVLCGVSIIIEHLYISPLESHASFSRIAFLCISAMWFALGPAWIAVFILQILWNNFVSPLSRYGRSVQISLEQKREARKQREEEEKQKLEYERHRPERERMQREAVQREQEHAQREASRRELWLKARARCEYCYSTNYLEINKRFPKATFESFLNRYLGEDCPLDLIDSRASELIALIEGHLNKLGIKEKMSLSQLIEWYETEKRTIEEKNLAPDDEDMLLRGIEEHFGRLQAEYIRNMKP